jgi:transposase InsO family protein
MLKQGIPKHIRLDNEPEFVAKASPWENGYVESFNGKLRDELLNREIFTTLQEAKVFFEVWRGEYNQVRLHGLQTTGTRSSFRTAYRNRILTLDVDTLMGAGHPSIADR